MVKRIVLSVIALYQRTLSPDHGLIRGFFPNGACRFQPTCSEYAHKAVKHYGVMAGLRLGLARVSRCHPFHQGGYDPVPNIPTN